MNEHPPAAAANPPDPSTYYSGGDQGYIDYPFLEPSSKPQLPTLQRQPGLVV